MITNLISLTFMQLEIERMKHAIFTRCEMLVISNLCVFIHMALDGSWLVDDNAQVIKVLHLKDH